MKLPESWVLLSHDDAQALEKELRRELPPFHELQGDVLVAFARRLRCDEVLFRSPTGEGPVFWVHLTWAVETDPKWPWTETYENMADFLERWPREELDDTGEDAG